MKKFFRIFWISLLVLVFLGTMVFLWMKSRPEVQTWQLLSPQTRTIENSIIATGKVEPSNEVQIKPQISGIIDAIHYDPGDDIKIGDIIATIKVVPEMSSLNSAEGRLKVAEINYEKALREHKRNEELYGKGILSEEEFETSRTTLDNAKEEVDNSKDALKIITDGVSEKYDHLSNTLVRSTITGKILDIPVEVGNSVIQANTFNDGTTIATVADLGNMLFKGNIDESDVGKIRDGMPVKVKIGALQGVDFDAVLTYISPKSEEVDNVVMFEIEADLEIPDSISVRAGYSANAKIITEKRDSVMTIEESCVKFAGDTSYVEIFKGMDKKEQLFERKDIKIGMSDGVYIEVLEGLAEDDKVKGNLQQ
ncbi:MAG: efflux RND transporter periplasmic adaptor subunit [Bacteroidetes bacterium]|uniref:Efflux RND transporter periplasmic adaptor subunit n=1 Tax=Candidatus Cryptobacteroides faecavium TaxID=2840762 RepID=A0A9D9IGU2_9BACT|nr:efflux RND transporter periplasmic adaptor subunit [Candidatus Cryptobacteroides faecavium]